MAVYKIIIITAPSGAGKTSITRHLMSVFPQLAFSVSATTRPRRAAERDGIDYHFLSDAGFKQHIQQGDFVEWEMVYEGKYYGTLKSELDRIWAMGRVPVLDIDVKGAIHVQQQYPENCLSIFIDPPSVAELRKRLESRGTETASTLEARVNKAAYEMSFKAYFDQVIVNDDLSRACQEAEVVVGKLLRR
jgi:guanylate kinase